jgi:RPA family protein
MNCGLELIWLFFTKEMLQEVVAHTSTYAHIQITQKSSSYTNKEGSWTSTNIEEIERLIAFLVYAGVVKVKSEIENYWSVKTLYNNNNNNHSSYYTLCKASMRLQI